MICLHPKSYHTTEKDLEKSDWKQTSRLEACLTLTTGRLEADYVKKCLKFDVVIKQTLWWTDFQVANMGTVANKLKNENRKLHNAQYFQ